MDVREDEGRVERAGRGLGLRQVLPAPQGRPPHPNPTPTPAPTPTHTPTPAPAQDCFLELGLVKAAFLWELLQLGYDVLISDLDVVWLSAQWEAWMTYRVPSQPPLPEVRVRVRAGVRVRVRVP